MKASFQDCALSFDDKVLDLRFIAFENRLGVNGGPRVVVGVRHGHLGRTPRKGLAGNSRILDLSGVNRKMERNLKASDERVSLDSKIEKATRLRVAFSSLSSLLL